MVAKRSELPERPLGDRVLFGVAAALFVVVLAAFAVGPRLDVPAWVAWTLGAVGLAVGGIGAYGLLGARRRRDVRELERRQALVFVGGVLLAMAAVLK